jgi:predicted amidohydrolase
MITSNYVGQFAGLEFGGLSRIVDPLGQVVATTGSAEGLALATIDVREGIQQAAAALMGARIVRDRHPDAYRALRGETPIVIDG